MTFISIITLLIFIAFSTPLYCQEVLLSPLCTTVCDCESSEDEGTVVLDCSRTYLTIIPPVSDWPNNITFLDLSSNNITALDFELAQSTIKGLDLSYNKIRKIVQSAFGGLKSLKYLNLANNDIEEFAETGFYGLNQLASLNVSNNILHLLPDKLFYNFIGLQELSLAGNPLVHLDPIHFNSMINLRWLDLSSIDAYILDSKIFHTTGQLEYLDLSSNEFTDVPTDALRSAKSLKHLKLNGNPLTTLNKKSFTKLSTLEVLELNYLDKLKKVEDEVFSDLTNLRILEIKHGRELSYVSPNAFNGLFKDARPTLEELDLQGNQLRTLEKTMVPCAKLRKFNVQQNPWNCDCMLKWFKECHIQRVYAADLKCATPSKIADLLILSLTEADLNCDYMLSAVAKEQMHHDRLVRSISVGLGVTLLVMLAFGIGLVFKWRDMKEWYRKNRKGPGAVYYVRARSNPREI